MTNILEKKFAAVFHRKYAVAFINGTATLHAALVAAGVGPGDEVIVPPLTAAATSFAVLHAGALPVFADIDPQSWTIDPSSIQSRITPRTKAIIAVAIYGLAPNFDAIREIASRHDLFVLEDDAQCFLGYYKGSVVGSLGDAASFSFQSSKHMTSGEGGMVTTNDEELANRIRRFNSLGYGNVCATTGRMRMIDMQDPKYERHVALGWNYRMPELCAAVALGQLERLEQLVNTRVEVAKALSRAIDGCSWLTPQRVPPETISSCWTFVAKLREAGPSWYEFRDRYLSSGGDEIYGAWQLTYLEPALRGRRFSDMQRQSFAPGICPVAESVQPLLLQFKTNYFDSDRMESAAEALRKTIDYFGRR